MRPTIWLKRWHSITSNSPMKKVNPSGLEVSLKLMHLLSAKIDAMTQRLDRLNVNDVNLSVHPHVKFPVQLNIWLWIAKLVVYLPKTLMSKSIMSITTWDRPMTLIPTPTIRVGGINQISQISLTFPTCPKWMLDHPWVSKTFLSPTSSTKV